MKEVNFQKKFPVFPFHVKILFKSHSGARDMYIALNKPGNVEEDKIRTKWSSDLSVNLDSETWDTVFYICHCIVKDNTVIWFQYRILNRILGTNKLRYACKQIENSKCRLCKSQEESLIHLFYNCDVTKQFYNLLVQWVEDKIKFKVPVNPLNIILGYLIRNQHFVPANTLYLVAKKYIFSCAYTGRLPNIPEFRSHFRSLFNEQQMLAKLENASNDFENQLGRWRSLFDMV